LTKKNYKNLITNYWKKLNDFDLNSFLNSLKEIQLDDIKNINYQRLLFDIKRSKFTKPSIGILGASLLFVFFLIPIIEKFNDSIKTMKQYRNEAKNLPALSKKLEDEREKYEIIAKLMKDVNDSFLDKERIIFITELLNEASKKSSVTIENFTPILKADSSKLCKVSKSQKNNQKFKPRRKKTNLIKKGSIQDNFYELTFSSNYLDLIQFLKEIQFYDVMVIPYCLEVSSVDISNRRITDENNEDNSLIIPLDDDGLPISQDNFIDSKIESSKLGNVKTRIVLKIPTYSK
tara:strand:+ start:5307 stop:6176 length:870 start_codon:yes stop_codon:yes gene_type:complete